MPKVRKGRGKKRKRKGEKRKKKSCVDQLSDFHCDPSKVPKEGKANNRVVKTNSFTMERKRTSEEILSCSSSSSVGMVPNHEYDIFLSFRGLDTRRTFTAHLYERLTRVGFRVYKDEIEMEKGEYINDDLMKAISSSRVCIPIFSKDYASSKACLRELSHMLECEKKIRPIFYDVTPDDVKLKTGLYKDALLKHQGHVGLRDEIEKWEKALISVGKISGYNSGKENEADEITSITQDLMKLMPKDQDMTDLLIDVDDHVEQVKSLLCLNNSDNYRIIGIHGLGGIGKTTLAKTIFNKIHSSFKGCSFLENVREKMQMMKHVELQQQLYADIVDHKLSNEITSRNDGIEKLKRGLGDKKILLVLDDMKCVEQLEELFGNEIWFAKGSRIIITTRDKGTLDVLKLKYKEVSYYKLEEMKDDQALKLFCRSAFRKDSPCVGYESLSEKAISYTGGLPLAIKVIGSLLSTCIDKDVWESTLEEQRSCLEANIKKTMMTSYKALNRHQQNIFLDIANYPGDLHKESASYMWKDCKWNPYRSIPVLVNHSLVNIINKGDFWEVGGEYLRMHDVLKDFGRDLVQEESEKRLSPPSRLHINGNLGNLHGKEACVETLSISNATITTEDMIGLCELRFLELSHCKVMGNFEGSFPKLRWLSLNIPLSVKRTNSFWKRWSTTEANKLKVLHLNGCDWNSRSKVLKSSIDWIGNLTSLCKLEIINIAITELPDSIERLQQLKELRVHSFESLKRVRDLPLSLTHLYLHDVSDKMQVDWSNQFKLTNIIELEICCGDFSYSGSDYLSFEWIRSATNLKKLCLRLPYYIITDLENVVELSALEHLDISFATFQDLQHLPSSLLHLRMYDCEFPNGIHLPSSLLHLEINYSKFPNEILDVSNLKDLEHLKLDDELHDKWIYEIGEEECDGLVEIKGLGESLHILELDWCPRLRNIHALGPLNELESLELLFCESLECVPNLSKSRKLKRVKIWGCPSLKLGDADLSKLENAQNMIVDIRYCNKLPIVREYNSEGFFI